jgi:hypothetical protein
MMQVPAENSTQLSTEATKATKAKRTGFRICRSWGSYYDKARRLRVKQSFVGKACRRPPMEREVLVRLVENVSWGAAASLAGDHQWKGKCWSAFCGEQ